MVGGRDRLAALAGRADAYTASGDRVFPATQVLPQLAPGDEFYPNFSLQPLSGGAAGSPNRATDFTAARLLP